jgi:hypothetical protein
MHAVPQLIASAIVLFIVPARRVLRRSSNVAVCRVRRLCEKDGARGTTTYFIT